VISPQTLLGRALVVGGRTALELQGYAHDLSQETEEVHLYLLDELQGRRSFFARQQNQALGFPLLWAEPIEVRFDKMGSYEIYQAIINM
jgi:hypothetical protein